jgi:hypothetical protein
MPDEETMDGPAAVDAGSSEDEQQSARPRDEEGSEGTSEDRGREGEQRQSNVGDWDPGQQSGGGGELY